MPSKDPLDQIMSTLRSSKSIDPARGQVRQSRMKQDKTRMGIGAGQTGQLGKPPITPARKPIQPNYQTPTEFGGPGVEQTQEMGLISTLIDQLNEAIISIKVQVEKSPDEKTKNMLTEKANIIRQQIVELGGVPIQQDESVNQGVQKLTGQGYIGRNELNMNMGLDYGTTAPRTVSPIPTTPTKTTTTPLVGPNASPNRPVMDAANQPRIETPRIPTPTPTGQVEQTLARAGVTGGSRGSTGTGSGTRTNTSTGATYTYTPPKTDGTGAVSIVDSLNNMFGPESDIRATFDNKTGEVVISGPSGEQRITPTSIIDGVSYATEKEIVDAVITAGALDVVMRPGAPIIIDGRVIEQPQYAEPTMDDVYEFMGGMGLDVSTRMTEEEYIQMRRQEKEKEYIQAIGSWNTAIETFKNDSENQYRIAERKIMQQASTMKGEMQEEFASRGMYYTSVMAQGMANIDDETMNYMADIAIETANKISEMGTEVTRLEELKALDDTLAYRREYEDRTDRLVEIGMNVNRMLIDSALTTFNAEWTSYTWGHQQQIVAWQERANKLTQEKNDIGVVQWALSDPQVTAELQKHGSISAIRNASPADAARLINQIINVSVPMRHNQEAHDMQLAVSASQITLNRAYAAQARAATSATYAGMQQSTSATFSAGDVNSFINEMSKHDPSTATGKAAIGNLSSALYNEVMKADPATRAAIQSSMPDKDWSSSTSFTKGWITPVVAPKKPSLLSGLMAPKDTQAWSDSMDKSYR